MDDALRERVEALERAVTDGEHDLSAVADEAEALDRLDELEESVTALEEQVDELQAATQALRGYVGNVRSVNTDIEQRADAALAKVESLEQRLSDSADSHRSPDDGQASRNQQVGDAADELRAGANNTTSQSDSRQPNPTQQTRRAAGGTAGVDRSKFAGHSRDPHASGDQVADPHPTDGGYRESDSSQCASCGRPREPSEAAATTRRETASESTDNPGRQATAETGGQRASRQSTRTKNSLAEPHGPEPDTSTTDATPSTEPVGGVDGVPTVESLARGPSDVDDTGNETLPSGDADPLVGATEESEAGTLQRIRDLL